MSGWDLKFAVARRGHGSLGMVGLGQRTWPAHFAREKAEQGGQAACAQTVGTRIGQGAGKNVRVGSYACDGSCAGDAWVTYHGITSICAGSPAIPIHVSPPWESQPVQLAHGNRFLEAQPFSSRPDGSCCADAETKAGSAHVWNCFHQHAVQALVALADLGPPDQDLDLSLDPHAHVKACRGPQGRLNWQIKLTICMGMSVTMPYNDDDSLDVPHLHMHVAFSSPLLGRCG